MEQEKSTDILPRPEMYYDLDAFIREYDGKIPLVIFGTGNYGEFIFHKLTDAGIHVDCFTCIIEEMYGSKYCNTDVAALSSVIERDVFILIAIVAVSPKTSVLHRLLKAGVRRERIITPIEPFGLFYDEKLLEVPEFAEAIEKIILARIHKEQEYFCDYFVTNELMQIAMLGKDEFSQVAEDLLFGTGVEIRYIDSDSQLDGFDAILLTDRENFFFLEEQLMARMGEVPIPVVDFWSVVKES